VLNAVNKIKRILPFALLLTLLLPECITPSFSFIFRRRAVQLVEIDIDAVFLRGFYHKTVKAVIIAWETLQQTTLTDQVLDCVSVSLSNYHRLK